MIEAVYAKGFKGLDFEMSIGKRNLVVGLVGSGKTARSLAPTLLITGSVQVGGVSKKAGDIFKTLCSGDELEVGSRIDGVDYMRKLTLSDSGRVSTYCAINGARTKKNDFEKRLAETGVAIADIQSFVAMSDAKKVEILFDLFPPSGDITSINKKIAETQEILNREQAEAKNKRGMVEEFRRTIATMDLPAGNLGQCKAKIAEAEKELAQTREVIADMRQQAYEHEQEQKRNAETGKAQPEPEQGNLFDQQEQTNYQQLRQESYEVHKGHTQNLDSQDIPPSTLDELCQKEPLANPTKDAWVASLEKIKSILEKQSCGSMCAAYMIVKNEIRKARG